MPKQFVIGRGWLPWSWRFKLLFVRHRRFLTFLGALIVFLTFITKEGLKENLKELVESVKTAESDFKTDVRNAESAIALDRIERDILLLEYKQGRNDADETVDDLRNLSDTGERLRSVEASLKNVTQLWRKVSNPDRGELKKLAEAQANLRTAAENYQLVFETGIVLTPDPTSYGGHRYQFGEVQKKTEDLLKQAKQVSDQIFAEVDYVRKSDEDRLRKVTWASYILFTLGWGLALVGRLYGVEASGGE